LKALNPKFVAAGICLCLLLGCEWEGSHAEGVATDAAADDARVAVSVPGAGIVEPSPFVEVAEKVMPGVVSIDTKKRVDTQSQFPEPMDELFRGLIPDLPRRQYDVPGYASGFILDSRGYVVTNNHVVTDAEEITVRMYDETEYEAEVVGNDPHTDVAVLKIEPNGEISPVRLGDSDAIRVGDWAIAIGNPFGRLQGTVTVGVVSAKGRSALSIQGGTPALQDFIQTDASINFGNSGGPLVNIEGEAIGMNTAINPFGQGIGFAIPINLVRHVVDEIIREGKVSWGFLGVGPQEITPDLADALGVDPRSGILVNAVVEGSAAEEAGIERGDIILEFDGERVTDVDQFRLKVASAGVGSEVEVIVLRDGKRRTLEVKLGERPTDLSQTVIRTDREDWLGVVVDDVSGRRGQRYAPSDVESGVVIVAVEDNSPAADAGLRVGDLVEEVNGEAVDSLDDYDELIEEAKQDMEKPVLFLVRRDGPSRYVAVKPRQN
jgi:serine protease Do